MIRTGTNILALDVGERRIGVARANLIARLAEPLSVLERTDETLEDIAELIKTEDAAAIVVGWPRGMQGQHTEQTLKVEAFIDELKGHVSVPVHTQDEALTSVQAEKELQTRGMKIDKGMIDALAATYILEDYLREYKD